MVEQIFHFTIGPVQGFVAQARRTRDLWAGSFLLSWLAGQAMAAVFNQGGTITFPDVGTKSGSSGKRVLRGVQVIEPEFKIFHISETVCLSL